MKQWILFFLMIGLRVMIGVLHRAGLNLIEETPGALSSLRIKDFSVATVRSVWPGFHSFRPY